MKVINITATMNNVTIPKIKFPVIMYPYKIIPTDTAPKNASKNLFTPSSLLIRYEKKSEVFANVIASPRVILTIFLERNLIKNSKNPSIPHATQPT